MLCMFICAFSLHEESPIDLEAMNPSFLGGSFTILNFRIIKETKNSVEKLYFNLVRNFMPASVLNFYLLIWQTLVMLHSAPIGTAMSEVEERTIKLED
jgi:hypothetical protein